ncbi:hypothetical protein [Halosimplex pelagicum]|uniref:Uncharacterized protein n=1 Tax=Halosimplex pelagicum TaxID=869886 RepID=A0A7D5TCR2_9EURY|nr:hypothetical protein [Halosimplex pelagicum]QLH83353.1 hypothetical protein HZS54_17705 [Halosimplex pelagicum]
MAFEGDPNATGSGCTDCETTTSASTSGVNIVEAADRVSTIMAPFTNLIAVLVNALTAYTLVKKL